MEPLVDSLVYVRTRCGRSVFGQLNKIEAFLYLLTNERPKCVSNKKIGHSTVHQSYKRGDGTIDSHWFKYRGSLTSGNCESQRDILHPHVVPCRSVSRFGGRQGVWVLRVPIPDPKSWLRLSGASDHAYASWASVPRHMKIERHILVKGITSLYVFSLKDIQDPGPIHLYEDEQTTLINSVYWSLPFLSGNRT